ncbi:MAG: hypothetical protein KBA30_01405 [Clostridia bacterium]|nr:hypothetical protein [Clostridia bacterium]
MRLEGSIYQENKLLNRLTLGIPEDGRPLVFNLDRCLLAMCKELGVPLPVWMEKNTREFAAWRQTSFSREQFVEKTLIDRFQIRMME